MNQLPTNNSIGIAMDLRSCLNIFFFNTKFNFLIFVNIFFFNTIFNFLIFVRDFYISTEWDVMEVPAQRNEKYYPCCEVKEIV